MCIFTNKQIYLQLEKADSYYFKGGEIEKANGIGNGQLKHQYSNTVEMEDAIKHPMNGNSKSKEASAMETKEIAANGTTNESKMT